MTTAQHPARSRSGFAGLRLVPPHSAGDEPEPVTFTVQILVENGRVSIEWDPHTPDVARYLYDVKEVIGAAVFALNHDQDVDGRIQASYDGRVMMRERAERERAAFEADHPWVCGCGKRCKSEAGLMTHRRAGDPRCG